MRVAATVTGAVQGVGFRWWTRSRALELGLVGTATNLPDGTPRIAASSIQTVPTPVDPYE